MKITGKPWFFFSHLKLKNWLIFTLHKRLRNLDKSTQKA